MSIVTKFNKLVRDKIPERLNGKGIKFESHIVDGEEYSKKLIEKLREEVEEFAKAGSEEELADIFEVIYSIIKNKGFLIEDIENIRAKKLVDRGEFDKGIVLDSTEE